MVPLAVWGVGRGRVPHLLSGLLLGLTPYLLIPLLAQNPTPVVWGDPSTVSGWLWVVSGRVFASNVFALPLAQWPTRLAEWGLRPFSQFTLLGLPLLFYGLYVLRGLGEHDDQEGETTGNPVVGDLPTSTPVVPPLRTTHHAPRTTQDKEGETTGNPVVRDLPTSTPVVPPLRTTHHAPRTTQHATRTTQHATRPSPSSSPPSPTPSTPSPTPALTPSFSCSRPCSF